MAETHAFLSLPLRSLETAGSDTVKSLVGDNGNVVPYDIPDFKIGTLDALVQQADQLAKLEAACEAVVAKVNDSLRAILNDDKERMAKEKKVNGRPTGEFIQNFSWDKVRYRPERPIGELIDILHKELAVVDNDVKGKFGQYQAVKNSLAAIEKKRTGNLTTKSLAPLVDPSVLVQDSEYLETQMVVVPTLAQKDFLRSYETISPMVVPRSSVKVTQDDEFTLYAVTVFKKHAAEFIQKCREQKWTPRQYKYVEGGREEEQQEADRLSREEQKSWAEALRFAHMGWSESLKIWIHVLTLRVFVETVLRYGLPLEYLSVAIQTTSKHVKKIKNALDSSFSYLGGRYSKAAKDDILATEMAAVGMEAEYTAYVYYELELP